VTEQQAGKALTIDDLVTVVSNATDER